MKKLIFRLFEYQNTLLILLAFLALSLLTIPNGSAKNVPFDLGCSVTELKDSAKMSSEVFVTADEMPKFLQQESAHFIKWIQNNFTYSREVLEKQLSGKIYVQFVVESDGTLSNIKIARGLDPDLDNEMIRVVNSSPLWTPGLINGDSVSVVITLPVEINTLDYLIQNADKYGDLFFFVDEFPKFLDRDMEYFSDWIMENINYPKKAERRNIEGEVVIDFYINEAGKLEDIVVTQSAHPLLVEEALRVIKNAPTWTPAHKHGKNVRFPHSVSIDFSNSYTANFAERFGSQQAIRFSKETGMVIIAEQEPPVFLHDEYKDFQDYIQTNLVYPIHLGEIPGIVEIQFDLNEEGLVRNPKVIKSLHPLLDAETMRVVVASPQWQPAKQNGQPVGTRLYYSAYFLTKPSETEEVFQIVDDMPTFNGGDMDDFRRFIAFNLRYPQEAAAKGIQGRVFIQFMVDKEGNVTDVMVVRGAHKLLDEEAIRLVESSPKWKPGKQNGVPVNVRFTFPINFVFSN
jgi:TonB family protein